MKLQQIKNTPEIILKLASFFNYLEYDVSRVMNTSYHYDDNIPDDAWHDKDELQIIIPLDNVNSMRVSVAYDPRKNKYDVSVKNSPKKAIYDGFETNGWEECKDIISRLIEDEYIPKDLIIRRLISTKS